jgi:hypothetical protein
MHQSKIPRFSPDAYMAVEDRTITPTHSWRRARAMLVLDQAGRHDDPV